MMGDQTPDRISVTKEGGILESYNVGSLEAEVSSSLVFAGFGIDASERLEMLIFRFQAAGPEGPIDVAPIAMSFGSAEVLSQAITDVLEEISVEASANHSGELTDSVDSGEDEHSE